jgi:hypothetical protein
MSTTNDPNEAMKAIQQAMASMDTLGNNSTSKKDSQPKTADTNNKTAPTTKAEPKKSVKPLVAKAVPNKAKSTGFLSWIKSFFQGTATLVLFLAASPLLLVKGAMWLHLHEGWNSYLSLGASTGVALIVSSLLISIYMAIFFKKAYFKRVTQTLSVSWLVVMIPLMLFGGLVNSKNQAISGEFSTAHPLLKMAVSTYSLFDKDVVMTDISRTPSDYEQMGLTPKQYSKHFEQADGYVHAIDLRTIGRPEWQNTLAEYSFNFMGFNTLRHVGTADHLHISM